MHRVLLVEFAAVGRYHRALQFPYLAGLLESAGVPFHWLRFAVAAEREHGVDGIDLVPADAAVLRDRLERFHPERVVFSRFPAEPLAQLVLCSDGPPLVYVLGDTYASGAAPDRVATLGGSPEDWRELAGIAAVDRGSAGSGPIVPSFAYEPANTEASSLQPLPFLVFGAECTYERPLSSHPLYQGIDLSSCVRRGGCAFCNRPAHQPGGQRFTAQDARGQLEALRRTLPSFDGRVSVRLVGEPAISHAETIAGLVRELGFAPADWLLDARADRLVTCEQSLARACAQLDGTGHCLHVALVGVESFVRSDLDRMNKGTDPLQNLDAALVLFRMERDHPDSFSFRTFGGLSTIFFTPWTTLEDLAMNLRVVQQCGLSGVAGKVLGDRLRLEPGLPITALAKRDGLLLDRYDDPALDTAARHFYGTELPWRFRDTRLEPLSRIFVRLLAAASGQPIVDPLGQRVGAWWAGMAKQRYQPVDAALRLIDGVESRGWSAAAPGESVAAAGDILDAYERGIEAQPAPLPGADQNRAKAESSQGASGGTAATDGGGRAAETPGRFAWAAYLVALCRAGLKPVSKIEPLQPDEVDDFVREIQPPNPRTRIFESASSGRVAHVFFGESPAKVDEAIDWTAKGEDDPSDKARDQAVCEAGKLLGYPSCCAEAFAFRETPRSRLSYAWMHLHRRMQHPDEVDALLNPWASALFESYVPCSLQCTATKELLHAAERVARQVRGDSEVDRMRESCARPWLVVLSGQGSALELIPEQEPGERFRYSAGRGVGHAAESAQAMRADELVIDHERLQLLHGGALVADLSLRAFVWWHRRALQPELWTRVLALREFLGRDHHAAGRAALDVDGGLRVGPQMVALHKLLSTALTELGRGGRLQRIRVVRLRPVSAGMLSLELAAAGRTIELYVADARQTTQDAMRVGPFAFMRPEHQSLEAAVDKAVVQALSAQLSAWLVTRQRAVRQKDRGAASGRMRSEEIVTNFTCNQACLFCRARRPLDAPEFVATRAVVGRIAQAVRRGAERIILTGGEPALRKDLPLLVATARKAGANEVWLETNATLVDRERAQALRLAGLDVARIQLSGFGSSLDNVTQDAGGFEAALRGLEAFAAVGVAVEVCAVLSRSALPGIAALPAGLAGMEARGVSVRCLWLSAPVLEPGDSELPDATELVRCVDATMQSARKVALDVKLEPRGAPPPCTFPDLARMASLFALAPGRRAEPGFSRIEACTDCLVSDRCPGWSPAHLSLFDPAAARPIDDDRLRRRLTLISTVREQIDRELVEPGTYRDADGNTWEEAIVRVNFRCSQHCRFCFVSTHLPDPPDDEVCQAIDAAAARGARIVLSGGEPTLHTSLPKFATLAVRQSRHPVQLQTNAIRCASGTLAADLRTWGVKEAFVSLHAACAEVSDAITGAPGTFDKTVAGVDNLVAAGIGLTLNFVLFRSNLGELERWVRLAANRWPSARLNLSFVAPATDLVPLDQETVPRYSEVLPAVARAANVAAECGMVMGGFESMCGLPLCLVPEELAPRLQLSEIPPGFDRGEFVKTDECGKCSLRASCYGIRRRYVELYGAGELRAR